MNHLEKISQSMSRYQSCLDSPQADWEAAMAKSTDPGFKTSIGELLDLLKRKRAAIEPNSMVEMEGLEARIQSGLRRFAELQARRELITQRLAALANPPGNEKP